MLNYDIAACLASGDVTNPSAYRLREPTQFVFKLNADGEDELSKALIVWTTDIRGRSKLVTRVRTESQVRRCRRTNLMLPMTGDSIAAG